jgi:hypothetical protein
MAFAKADPKINPSVPTRHDMISRVRVVGYVAITDQLLNLSVMELGLAFIM